LRPVLKFPKYNPLICGGVKVALLRDPALVFIINPPDPPTSII